MVTVMVKDKVYVDRDEFMEQMLKCFSSDEWKHYAAHLTGSENNAALSGAALASIYASVHTPQHNYVRTVRPCNWCGECPVWTVAFEEDSELDTWPKVIAECVHRKCNCVGEDVRYEI